MEMIRLTKNALKKLSQIGDRKYHQRYGVYLAEGIRFVEEAFRASVEIKELIVEFGAEKHGRVAAIIEQAQKNWITVWHVSSNEMERISRTETNQGIAAAIALPKKGPGEIFGDLIQVRSGIVAFLDGVQDPGNVGTIIRTCEAFDVEGVVLGPGSAGLFNPKTLRSSMGAVFRVPVAELHDKGADGVVSRFSREDFQIVAADNGRGSTLLGDCRFADKVLLIIGSEGAGISEDLVETADIRVEIETPGPTESLNAAIAAGILIYAIKNPRAPR
jgi:TrmH family RNA methyltransferase